MSIQYVWCWDWNPQSSEHVSPPKTNRQGSNGPNVALKYVSVSPDNGGR